jgi:hypothetical protein
VPGEERTLTARYRSADLGREKPVVTIDGWNVTG